MEVGAELVVPDAVAVSVTLVLGVVLEDGVHDELEVVLIVPLVVSLGLVDLLRVAVPLGDFEGDVDPVTVDDSVPELLGEWLDDGVGVSVSLGVRVPLGVFDWELLCEHEYVEV